MTGKLFRQLAGCSVYSIGPLWRVVTVHDRCLVETPNLSVAMAAAEEFSKAYMSCITQ